MFEGVLQVSQFQKGQDYQVEKHELEDIGCQGYQEDQPCLFHWAHHTADAQKIEVCHIANHIVELNVLSVEVCCPSSDPYEELVGEQEELSYTEN